MHTFQVCTYIMYLQPTYNAYIVYNQEISKQLEGQCNFIIIIYIFDK